MMTLTRLLMMACALATLPACHPEPPDTDKPPEPQAAAQHTELRDAVQKPIKQAEAVQDMLKQEDGKQRAAIDAAER